MKTSGWHAADGKKRKRRASMLRRLAAHRRDLALVISAMGWLLLAWLAIDLLPFRLYRKMMRPPVHQPEISADGAPALIKRVAWAVIAVANRVPWRSVCFHRGLAAQRMLCRAGIHAELHYGVAKSTDKEFEAHVWVTANGQTVVGGETQDRFTVLGIFSGQDSSAQCADSRANGRFTPL